MFREIYQNFKAGELASKIKSVESAGGKSTKDELRKLQFESLRLAKSKCADVRKLAQKLKDEADQLQKRINQ